MDRESARLLCDFVRRQPGWYAWRTGTSGRFANSQHTGVSCCKYTETGVPSTGLIFVRSYAAFYRLRKLVENNQDWRSQLVDGEFR